MGKQVPHVCQKIHHMVSYQSDKQQHLMHETSQKENSKYRGYIYMFCPSSLLKALGGLYLEE